MKAIYPGSFDPLTNGHVDVIERSLALFSELTLLIAPSVRKTPLLKVEERVGLAKAVFKEKKQVKVVAWDGLVVDYAKKENAQVIIRGLRAASDFEYEFMMAAMNKKLNSKVETFFIMTGQDLFFISSTMIKELHQFKADIRPYVPTEVWKYLSERKAT